MTLYRLAYIADPSAFLPDALRVKAIEHRFSNPLKLYVLCPTLCTLILILVRNDTYYFVMPLYVGAFN
jgi:hypothetical protein